MGPHSTDLVSHHLPLVLLRCECYARQWASGKTDMECFHCFVLAMLVT